MMCYGTYVASFCSMCILYHGIAIAWYVIVCFAISDWQVYNSYIKIVSAYCG